jgi:hypothetical protein
VFQRPKPEFIGNDPEFKEGHSKGALPGGATDRLATGTVVLDYTVSSGHDERYMHLLNRRRFISNAVATMASLSCASGCKSSMDAGSGNRLKIIPHSDRAHAQVPKKFIGLSYDSNTLSDVNFFSASNEGLVDLFRKMTPNGVLRLGGGSLDVEWWAGSSSSDVPSLPPTFAIPPHPTGYAFRPFSVEITPESIEALKGFLNATGWTCIYGLNLATGTPARAAEEADFVAKTLGSLLEFFQIGNEPDLYNRFCRNPATWSADRYFDEWLPMANAVRARVPHARFALPDLGYVSTWFTPLVNRFLALPTAMRPNVIGLSYHYYALNLKYPTATMSKLLKPDPVFDHISNECLGAAARLGIKCYITECNSCTGVNIPTELAGVFGSALWAADYTLKVMSLGYEGISMYTQRGITAAFGQFISLADPQSYKSKYPGSPICSPTTHMHVPEPVFYGMQFASNFAGATFIDLDFSPGNVNATAYAAKLANGKIAVAIINKDPARSLEVDLSGFSSVLFLRGSSLTSNERVQLFGPIPIGGMSTIPSACGVLLISKE